MGLRVSQIIKLLMFPLSFLFSPKSLASEAASGEVRPDPGSPHALSRFLMLQAFREAAEQVLLSFTITSACLLHSLQAPPSLSSAWRCSGVKSLNFGTRESSLGTHPKRSLPSPLSFISCCSLQLTHWNQQHCPPHFSLIGSPL